MNQSFIDEIKKSFAPAEPFFPKSVFIGVPCHDGYVTSQWSVSVIALMGALQDIGIQGKIKFAHNGGICLARNELTFEFMDDHSDCLFFLDADVCFEVDAFLRVLTSPADIAVGVYPCKSLDLAKIRALAPDQHTASAMTYPLNISHNQRNGGGEPVKIRNLIQVDQAATGFMRIKRNVIGKIENDNPNLLYFNDLNRAQYNLFSNTMEFDDQDRQRMMLIGEDYSFCRLAKKSGFDVYADLKVELGHCGQYEYRGNLGKSLRMIPNATLAG